MKPLVLLDGRIQPVEHARISPLDRGLLFGDGVYEVVRVESGHALFFDRHMRRLAHSLASVSIAPPAGFAEGCRELLAASELVEGSLYLQVTRGAGPRTHLPARELLPTAMALPGEHRHAPSGTRSMRAITMRDPRWQHCDIKCTSLMGTVLGKLAARDAGVDEVLFVAPEGESLREGGSTTLFVRDEDRLLTHPLDGHVLPGVTRERVLAFAHELGVPVDERAPSLARLSEWGEAFLCGTLTGVQPLVAIDDQQVGDGTAGPWTLEIARLVEAETYSSHSAAGAARA